jgi:hypothetical protein
VQCLYANSGVYQPNVMNNNHYLHRGVPRVRASLMLLVAGVGVSGVAWGFWHYLGKGCDGGDEYVGDFVACWG